LLELRCQGKREKPGKKKQGLKYGKACSTDAESSSTEKRGKKGKSELLKGKGGNQFKKEIKG